MTVAEMPLASIQWCLVHGIQPDGEEDAEAILERLRIELAVRELGLGA